MSDTKTVIVGCRIPSGLMLQLRDQKNPQLVVAEVRVEGASQKDAPFHKPYHAGFTEVASDHWSAWERWAKENKFQPFVEGAVFACPDRASAEAKAREMELERTLFEGLDVSENSRDPRMSQFRELNKFKGD